MLILLNDPNGTCFWWMREWCPRLIKIATISLLWLLNELILLVEAHSGSDIEGGGDQGVAIYAVFLPILKGDFKAVLEVNDQDEIKICVESGM